MATSERNFEGQVVVITGASSGIGAALGREFARQGANTVLVARRIERIEALAAELTSGGRRAVAVAGDVTRDGDMERAVELARAEFGRLDAAVANAGILVKGEVLQLTLDDYRKQLETNTLGALRLVKAGLPELEKTRGRIVLVGSLFGMVSVPEFTPYCMSKFALNALAEGLSYELAPSGISVTQVMCGFVDTEIYASAPLRRTPPKWMALTADQAARQIVSAAHGRQRCRMIPWPTRMAILLQRYAPGVVHLAINRAFSKAARPAN
ncbi:MAG TPA: SDR family NAD(P)-dependent oxidoreductase [Bryobacteraceae bacterium]|jgi:NAD(P)-dependent dehydrogenase (short-subunit alcohol dehydrogenase family)|nr:SDR family NAD(P)-dependent oxidoreductase [Bryobacteraceae bacterium]